MRKFVVDDTGLNEQGALIYEARGKSPIALIYNDKKTYKKDAALMAAAPEMYAELCLVRDYLVMRSLNDPKFANDTGAKNMLHRVLKILTTLKNEVTNE